jgi:hypothetical protein
MSTRDCPVLHTTHSSHSHNSIHGVPTSRTPSYHALEPAGARGERGPSALTGEEGAWPVRAVCKCRETCQRPLLPADPAASQSLRWLLINYWSSGVGAYSLSQSDHLATFEYTQGGERSGQKVQSEGQVH